MKTMRAFAALCAIAVLGTAVPAQGQIPADLENHHADLRSVVNSGNVGRMRPAWRVDTRAHVSHMPLVQGERVFFADWGGVVYAVDFATGDVVWKKQVAQPKTQWPWRGFAGTGALGGGMLFEASVEGNVFALDPNTGETVWSTRITDDPEAGNLAKVMYHDGRLFIGLQSVEEVLDATKPEMPVNFQGRVMALDAKTGRKLWETPLVQPPHNGVAVWSSFALDPETNTLYTTTGNNYTGEATEYADALLAMDANTGRIRWAKKVTDHDLWTKARPYGPDYDFGAGPQLFEAGGRKLVGAGQKSGTFYVWDRTTGEPVWTTTVGYGQIGGGIHGEGSIGDGRIYLWGNNAFPYANPEQHPMDITAVDAATGKAFWTKPKAQPAVQISAGFLASDVYFVGSLDGMVRAYRASDGELLWRSGDHGPVASSLVVERGTLLWGAGVPKNFGGGGSSGLVAYRVDPEARALAPPPPVEQAKSGGCTKILCSPTVVLMPGAITANLFNPARVRTLPDGTVTELNTVTDFLFRIGVAMPTGIPRTTLWFDVQWTPFAKASQNLFTGYSFGKGEVDANLPTFVYGFLIDLITAEQTAGWLTLGFDPLLVANPAGQPDDKRDYTHKLVPEARLGLGVFNWLPKGNWLRSVKGYALLDYIATGLPQAGDEVPKGAQVFLDDASPWVLLTGLTIPIAPFP